MTLQTTFHNLGAGLYELETSLGGLSTAGAVDRPLIGETILVDLFSDGLEDLAELLKPAANAAALGQAAAARSGDLSQPCRALVDCQRHFNTFFVRLASDLAAYERLAALDSLGQEQGQEWASWAQEVKFRLEQCQNQALELLLEMAGAWEELGDRIVPAISFQSVNVIQQSGPCP
jgi:hypothetical protein